MIENFPYKTSRDYERLQALLDAGKVIVCLADYRFPDCDNYRDICRGRMSGADEKTRYYFSARSIDYASVWPDIEDDFARICQSANIEFIDPGPDVTP